MKKLVWLCALAALTALDAAPAFAQAAAPAADGMPPMIFIYREIVRIGKEAAHDANEGAWAAAAAKMKSPTNFLAMTSLTGPSEAWYLSSVTSFAEWQKRAADGRANEAWSAANDKFAAVDGDLISAGTGILARYRRDLSYRASGNLADRRYMKVDIYRIKPGQESEFAEAWRMQVEAHTKAKMDENWAFFQVVSGMPQGTFLYLQSLKSMDEEDKAGEMHGAAAFRDTVGESGRAKMREMTIAAVDLVTRLYFEFKPNQSYVPTSYLDADAKYWTPPPPPAPAVKKPGER